MRVDHFLQTASILIPYTCQQNLILVVQIVYLSFTKLNPTTYQTAMDFDSVQMFSISPPTNLRYHVQSLCTSRYCHALRY